MKVIVLFFMTSLVSSVALAQQDTTSHKPVNPTTAYLPYLFNTPLFVIDGLIQKGTLVNGQILNTINPDKIDNIHVFKGDSAKNLFGERGKNGVVVITTKEFAKKPQIPKE